MELDFLRELLELAGPSGFEQQVQRRVKKFAEPFASSIEKDVHGNLIVSVNPKGSPRVMISGHCDQIGLMVTHIGEMGQLHISAIGGIDTGVVEGVPVLVHAKSGTIQGVVGRKPIHLTEQAERGKKVDLKKTWVDIGASSADEASALVEVGAPITFKPVISELCQGRLAAPAMDDRVGLFTVMEAARIFAASSPTPEQSPALFAVSTVQEELGLRGARTASYFLKPDVGIAVDVVHASDNPGAESSQVGMVCLGAGPVLGRGPNINPVLEKLLVEVAEQHQIPVQPIAVSRPAGNDANVMQISRAGVAAGIVGIPNRYMHTPVEITDPSDLENASLLLAKFLCSLSNDQSFIPE